MTNPSKPSGTLTILDCTLRDGGYYNAWDFPYDLARRYIAAVDRAGVDVVEIGFRAMRGDGFRGAYAFSTDEHLHSLPSLQHARLCVMLNAKDAIAIGHGDTATSARRIFAPRSASPVSMVRIAAHAGEVSRCGGLCETLRDLGYEVGFNIMQAGERSSSELRQLAAEVESWGSVRVLYFADSLGSMTQESVRATISALRDGWSGEVGFHAHDNCNAALANAMAAHDAGATWIDGTVMGMGRGAGNAQTEYLLAEFQRRGVRRCRPEAMLELLFEDFQELRAKHGWGPNLLYYMGATLGIHPTYVQEMLGTDRYGPDDVVGAIQSLASGEGASFSTRSLDAAVSARFTTDVGAWRAPALRSDASGKRTALLLAATPGLQRHAGAIESLVRRLKPTVFALNEPDVIDDTLVDYVVASHPTRVAGLAQRIETGPVRLHNVESEHYSLAAGAEGLSAIATSLDPARRRLIAPGATISRDAMRTIASRFEVCDFGLRVTRDSLSYNPSGCSAPDAGVGAYALCAAAACGAERILLAGFDGYGPGDERTRALNTSLDLFRKAAPDVRVMAITPTEYAVEQGSVYDDAWFA